MESKSKSEKTVVTDATNTLISKALLLREDPVIRRIRKKLMIMIGSLLVVFLISLIATISSFENMDSKLALGQSIQVGQILFSILIYAFGMFATYRYSSRFLHIFGWLGRLGHITSLIVIVTVLVITITTLKGGAPLEKMSISSMFTPPMSNFVAVFMMTAIFIYTIITVIVAFRLARLIDTKNNIKPQEI